ncbi:MAG: SWIM zinc finger family protein, partial [Clostridia bacterium]|nr:SWIM zinc finger family protein [Clostridia bacterium]
MTKLDLRSITSMVGHRCFADGMELYRAGNVRLDSRKSRLFSDWISIRGSADGYSCNANLFGNGRMQCYCECSDWQRAYACAHIAALLIQYAVKQDASILENADQDRAQALIAAYTPAKNAEDEEPVKITPVLNLTSAQPLAAFRIGREHAYLIKGIIDFARRMQEKETYRYGERFVYDHDPARLDARSQRLCLMICQYADGFYELLSRKRSLVQEVFGDVKEIPLS